MVDATKAACSNRIANMTLPTFDLAALPHEVYARTCRLLDPPDLASLEQVSTMVRRKVHDHGWQADHYQHPHNILHRPLDRYLDPPHAWKALVRERHAACRHPPTFSQKLHTLWVASLAPITVEERRRGTGAVQQRAEELAQAGHCGAANALRAEVQVQQNLVEACAHQDVAAARAAITAGACTLYWDFYRATCNHCYPLIQALCAGFGKPCGCHHRTSAGRISCHPLAHLVLACTYENLVARLYTLLLSRKTPPNEAAACLAAALDHGLPRARGAAVYQVLIYGDYNHAQHTWSTYEEAADPKTKCTSHAVAESLAALATVVAPPDGVNSPRRALANVADWRFYEEHWIKGCFYLSYRKYRAGDLNILVDTLLAAGCAINASVEGEHNALEYLLNRYMLPDFDTANIHQNLSESEVKKVQVKQLIDILIARSSRQIDLRQFPSRTPGQRAYIERAQARQAP